MVIWITGKAKAGKTTLAQNLAQAIPAAIVLDGDAMRGHFPEGYENDDRERNILRLAHFAAMLEEQGFTPIVSCISPKRIWRDAARQLLKQSILIYVPGGILWEGTKYEEPTTEELCRHRY